MNIRSWVMRAAGGCATVLVGLAWLTAFGLGLVQAALLTDLGSNRIIDESMLPRFKQGDYFGGISAGLDRMLALLDAEALPAAPARGRAAQTDFGQLAPLLLVIAVGLIVWFLSGAIAMAVLRGQTARERAIEVFATLRVWDTQHNTGVLIYVLLADHAVEIVADRGIHAQAGEATWSAICRRIEVAFAQSQYQAGALLATDAVAQVLRQHFPQTSKPGNELPDEPVLL